MYDGFGGSAQASHGLSPRHTATELGSSAWITDGSGNACTERSRSVNQYLAYMPFGESFIDQRNADEYDIRFKFTGKERDAESGFDYFGARYYASDLSVWLSVDPLSILYPNLSPYAYCDNNPIYYTDPDGRTIVPHGSPAFKAQFKKDLEMLSKTDRGKEIVAFLQSPAFQISIHESAWTKSGFNPTTNSVYYDNDNAFDYDYDGVEYVSFIALGHELQHAYDKYNMSGFRSASTAKKERSAVSFENYLRSVYRYELSNRGIPFALRYTYSKGTSLFWGRVLISGKSTTLFNSNMGEIDFNPDLERIISFIKNQSTTTFTLGDRNINIFIPGKKVTQKTYENKKSSSHATVRYL